MPYSLNFGNFDLENNNLIGINLIYIAATVINVVLMLNLLISILADSYDQLQVEKAIVDLREIAEMNLEIEKMFLWARNQKEFKYFHVMSLTEIDQDTENWEGRIRYLDKKIDKGIIAALNNQKTLNLVIDKMKSLDAKFENKITPIDSSISSFDNRVQGKIKDVEKKLDDKIEKVDKRIVKLEKNLKNVSDDISKILKIISKKEPQSKDPFAVEDDPFAPDPKDPFAVDPFAVVDDPFADPKDPFAVDNSDPFA